MFGLCPNILSLLWFLLICILLCYTAIPPPPPPGFSYNQLAVFTQCFPASQAVCYIFFLNYQLFFRIYSGFSISLIVNRCWVNDVHVGGLWCPVSPWFFIQSTFIQTTTMILGYWGLFIIIILLLLLWLCRKIPVVLSDLFRIFWLTMYE